MNVVIMAGGSGTRFWPVSRSRRPKQFLDIVGDEPMIVATHRRVSQLAPGERTLLVVGWEHARETEELFSHSGAHILVEPAGRNTAPCIGLAAQYISTLWNDDPMVILPADHYIARPEAFREALQEAAKVVAAGGGIATLGIVPVRPETGYGYIERDAGSSENERVHRVKRFVEKPDLETAEAYLWDGNFYWNAGIFVARPLTLLHELARHMPDFHQGLQELASTFNTPEFPEALERLYDRTEKISFDYAVMEKTEQPVHVIPCECGWSDVGSWYSLYEVRRAQEGDETGSVKDGEVWMRDCRDSFVVSRGGRWVAALGLRKVLVVDTDDALLVADLDKSQEIRAITDYLEKARRTDLL
jgi:mannose-1-phosphate guanylyltransferase